MRSWRSVSIVAIVFTVVAATCASPRNTAPERPVGTEKASGGRGGNSSPVGDDDSSDAGSGAGGEGGAGASDPNAPFTDPGCESGFHKCMDGMCISSSDPAHCGNACVPCPGLTGGTSTCDGVRCGVECPAGKKPCNDSCVDVGAACEGKCPDGKNPCNGICVDATSVSSCGTACVTCPTSQFGETSCDGDKCILACKAGYHACGPVCAQDTDPMTCGTSCSPCSVPTGGKATCDGTKCGTECPTGTKLCVGACIDVAKACEGTCPTGTHNCNDNCVSDKDTNSCGSQCTPCKVPANAQATCNGTSCDFTCRAGFHRCGDECKDNKSVNSCGTSSCNACPTAANATAACDGTKCSLKCGGNLFLCNGICQQCCNDGQCGAGKACSNNTCVTACVPNVSCTTGLGPCRAGKTACASPTSQAECRDSGTDDSRNTCGSGNVCKGGTCVTACKPGGSCTQNIGPCKAGKYVCDTPTSQPDCRESGNDDNHNTCGGGQLCSGGRCVAACKPTGNCNASACHRSMSVCKTQIGSPTCEETVDDNAGGCAGGQKCQSGKCVSACTPTNNPCNGHGTCNSNGTCDCRDRWIQSGSTCTDPCAGVSCGGAHGKCNGGACFCNDGYSGEHCETPPVTVCPDGNDCTGKVGQTRCSPNLTNVQQCQNVKQGCPPIWNAVQVCQAPAKCNIDSGSDRCEVPPP
jgi:hypothetical protein